MNGSTLLVVWAVFDRPLDYPRHVVVRVQRIMPGGIEHAFTACLYDTLAEAQEDMVWRGLLWLPRQQGDVPFLVGVWL